MKITNQNSYGNGVYLQTAVLRSIFIVLCVTTPATNWLIPIVTKKIKGRWFRW